VPRRLPLQLGIAASWFAFDLGLHASALHHTSVVYFTNDWFALKEPFRLSSPGFRHEHVKLTTYGAGPKIARAENSGTVAARFLAAAHEQPRSRD